MISRWVVVFALVAACSKTDDPKDPPKPVAPVKVAKPSEPSAKPDWPPAKGVKAGDDSHADTMDLPALCSFVIKRFCQRCAPAFRVAQQNCSEGHGTGLCEGLTIRALDLPRGSDGSVSFGTPASFRAACLAAVDHIDCSTTSPGTPPPCVPR